MRCAVVVVAIDHREAIKDPDIGWQQVFGRWNSYSDLAERLVVDRFVIIAPDSMNDIGCQS